MQVTDTHLCAQEGGELVGMDTDASLEHVLSCVGAEQPDIDLLLVTGDLTDNGNLPGYRRILARLERFGVPQAWLPGNHDDRDNMRAVAGDARLVRRIEAGDWQILLLDSTTPGEVGGHLPPGELDWLRESLAAHDTLHTLICLHHHPVPIGCDWLDEQQVDNSDAFWRIVEAAPNARGVLWGHVHQACDRERGGVRLMSSPSTCIQFAPHSPGFRLDTAPPGYRWLQLHGDGRIETGISRVQGVEFHVDFDSQGY